MLDSWLKNGRPVRPAAADADSRVGRQLALRGASVGPSGWLGSWAATRPSASDHRGWSGQLDRTADRCSERLPVLAHWRLDGL